MATIDVLRGRFLKPNIVLDWGDVPPIGDDIAEDEDVWIGRHECAANAGFSVVDCWVQTAYGSTDAGWFIIDVDDIKDDPDSWKGIPIHFCPHCGVDLYSSFLRTEA